MKIPQAVSSQVAARTGVWPLIPACLLLACVTFVRQTPAQQRGAPAPAQAGSAPSQANSAQAALATADQVLEQMSQITGLPVKSPLKKELVTKAQVERYLRDNMHAEYTPEEMHGEEAALKAFGIVEPSFNLENFLVTFYTEQAAGFYDPRRQTMFMADWVEPEQQKIVLAHELTHALQDQSFNLWQFTHSVRDNDDAENARDALVEGYATLSMMQIMLGSLPIEKVPSLDIMMDQGVKQSMSQFPVFSRAPFFLRYQLLFPYVQGIEFCRRALELGGWKRLNQTFAEPPRNTREIFEPGLYFGSGASGDTSKPADPLAMASAPTTSEVALPHPAALEHMNGVQRVEDNVMGALGYYALFGQLLTDQESKKVSATWSGDRYLVYEGPAPGQFLLISRTRWTTPEAAADFCTDYRTVLLNRWIRTGVSKEDERGSKTAGTATILLRASGSHRALLVRDGNECRWFEGASKEQADALTSWIESPR
jgi:hypothetical protein